MLITQHRDSRAVIVAISACTYDMAVTAVSCLLCFFTRSTVLPFLGSLGFGVILLYVIVRGNRKTPISDLLQNSAGRMRLCLVPALAFVALYVACVWPGNVFSVPESRIVAVVMIAVMFTDYRLVISLLRIRAESDMLASSKELLESYACSLQERIEDSRKSREKLSILRHDMRHKDQMILYYLDAGDLDAVRALAEQTAVELDATAEKRYCRDNVIDRILAHADQAAAARQVEFRCNADIPEIAPELPQELEFEFGTVVLNLLENAVRAAAAQTDPQKRYVRFTAHPVKKQMFLEVANPCEETPRLSPETGLPVTTQGTGHGCGLRSVRAFVDKRHASFDLTTAGGLFCVRILFPLSPET
jgi:signal transduction histidine kinase